MTSAAFIAINTIAACAPLYLMALLRLPLTGAWRRAMTRRMDLVIDFWVSANRWLVGTLGLADVQVTWPQTQLHRDRWYLVVSNHQAWADIILLQTTLRPAIPPLKFFTKRQLIWLPLVGLAMKLLGFPYVRRGGASGADRSGHDGGRTQSTSKDREATLASCAVFRNHPTSVLSFLEGTRFTPEKHSAQGARFQHLLNPKLGGISYALSGLAAQSPQLLDATLFYPDGAPSFWEFLTGNQRRVRIWIELHHLDGEAASQSAAAQRTQIGPLIEGLWRAKDLRLNEAAKIAEGTMAARTSARKHRRD